MLINFRMEIRHMAFLAFIASILLDAAASWTRMFAALFLSIAISIIVGIYAAVSRRAERVVIPVVDVLQTLPILAFFPFVIYVFVFLLPGYIGINAAVIFLIITSMIWNIIFGVYESIKTLPTEFTELSSLYGLGFVDRLKKIFIPAAMPRVVSQSVLSWSIGLFYLVTSEIFSIGNSNYTVKYGIGVALSKLAFSGNYTGYLIGLTVFIIFVVATRFLFFRPLEKHFTRYSKSSEPNGRSGALSILRYEMARVLHYVPHISHAKFGAAVHAKPRRVVAESTPRLRSRAVGRWIAMVLIVAVALLLSYVVFKYPVLLSYEYSAVTALVASFLRVWITFLLILVVAFPICVYLVFISKHRESYLTLFQIIASIPATILLPIIVLALSRYPYHGELVAFSIFFLSGIWYIIFGVIAGSSNIPNEVEEVKRLWKVKGIKAWKSIYVGALLPGLITGSITAIAAEWNASIVAEYFTTTGISGSSVVSSVGLGIGKLLDISLGSGNLVLMLVALFNLTVMIILINTFVWKRLYRKVSSVYR